MDGFWHGFTRLFKKIDPRCADCLVKLGVPNDSILMEEAMELIESAVLNKTVIVIDDYHLLSSDTIDRFIELLVKNAHPNLHIVIISRAIFGAC